MLTQKELDEVRRAVRHRRHLSWGTLEKLCALAQKGLPPEQSTFTVTLPPFKVFDEDVSALARQNQEMLERYFKALGSRG